VVTKARVLVLVSFGLVFGAGIAVGMLVGPRPPRRRDPGSWLSRELGLSAAQREQMQEIWSGAMGLAPAGGPGQRGTPMGERQRRVRDLLTETQLLEYEQIQSDFEAEFMRMAEERRAAFERAVERTKEILTPGQRGKYEAMLERMREAGERMRGPGRRGGPGGAPFGRHMGGPGEPPGEPLAPGGPARGGPPPDEPVAPVGLPPGGPVESTDAAQ
jgi:hypothetical protein